MVHQNGGVVLTTINRTFSLPCDLDRDLHRLVKKSEMSHFVSEALRKYLNERRQSFKKAHVMANEDEGQNESHEDWSTTIADGLEVDNEW